MKMTSLAAWLVTLLGKSPIIIAQGSAKILTNHSMFVMHDQLNGEAAVTTSMIVGHTY